MHRIDTSTAQRDKFGQGKNGFTRGNPQTGTSATQLDYLYCDAIQEEIANAIESAGIKLDKSKHDQLATAIKEFVKKGSVKFNSSTNSTSETEAATPLAVKKVNDNAVTANDKADNAHNRINAITDKFTSGGVESRVYSNDKRFYLLVRDDGVVGMYSTVKNGFSWAFNHDGWCEGFIDASRVGGLDQFIRDRIPPVGIPLPWPQVHPPVGWFECNGASFDVNQFPRLASAYPTGRLPDLRGEFIRGWDNARGADPYRVMLSWQSDAIRNIVGNFTGTPASGVVSGAFRETGNMLNGHLAIGQTGWKDRAEYSFDAARVVPISHDNHPRNVAFMYIVKAE